MPEDPESVRPRVLAAFAMMTGTVQLSRALADRKLADEVLEEGIKNTLALLGVYAGAHQRRDTAKAPGPVKTRSRNTKQ